MYKIIVKQNGYEWQIDKADTLDIAKTLKEYYLGMYEYVGIII